MVDQPTTTAEEADDSDTARPRDVYRASVDVVIPPQGTGDVHDAVDEFTAAETVESIGMENGIQVTCSVVGYTPADAADRARQYIEAVLVRGAYDEHIITQAVVYGPSNDESTHFGYR